MNPTEVPSAHGATSIYKTSSVKAAPVRYQVPSAPVQHDNGFTSTSYYIRPADTSFGQCNTGPPAPEFALNPTPQWSSGSVSGEQDNNAFCGSHDVTGNAGSCSVGVANVHPPDVEGKLDDMKSEPGDETVASQEPVIKKKNPEWFTRELKIIFRKQREVGSFARHTKDLYLWDDYYSLKSKAQRLSTQLQSEYYKRLGIEPAVPEWRKKKERQAARRQAAKIQGSVDEGNELSAKADANAEVSSSMKETDVEDVAADTSEASDPMKKYKYGILEGPPGFTGEKIGREYIKVKPKSQEQEQESDKSKDEPGKEDIVMHYCTMCDMDFRMDLRPNEVEAHLESRRHFVKIAVQELKKSGRKRCYYTLGQLRAICKAKRNPDLQKDLEKMLPNPKPSSEKKPWGPTVAVPPRRINNYGAILQGTSSVRPPFPSQPRRINNYNAVLGAGASDLRYPISSNVASSVRKPWRGSPYSRFGHNQSR